MACANGGGRAVRWEAENGKRAPLCELFRTADEHNHALQEVTLAVYTSEIARNGPLCDLEALALVSSPWISGAPQPGFSDAHLLKRSALEICMCSTCFQRVAFVLPIRALTYVPHVLRRTAGRRTIPCLEILQGALHAAQEAIKPDIAAQSLYKVVKISRIHTKPKSSNIASKSTLQLSILTSLCAQFRKLK